MSLRYFWGPVKGPIVGEYTELRPPQVSLSTFGYPCGYSAEANCQDCIHCDDPWECPGQESYHE